MIAPRTMNPKAMAKPINARECAQNGNIGNQSKSASEIKTTVTPTTGHRHGHKRSHVRETWVRDRKIR